MKHVNLETIPWLEQRSPKGAFHRFRRNIMRAMEAPKAGPKLPGALPFEMELVRLPPGAKNFPFHSHAAEWEFYLILSGAGAMRAGRKTVKLKPGDCCLCPPGEAHQIRNTGKRDLVYYVIGNNAPTDVWHYPDSGKWGTRAIGKFFRLQEVSYYDGEE